MGVGSGSIGYVGSRGGLIKVADGVTEEPLSVSAVWVARKCATRKPRPATFQEWRLSFEVECEAVEVLVTQVLVASGELRFGRTYRSGAHRKHSFSLLFAWHDYGSSDEIRIGFIGGNKFSVEDRQLGHRPQEVVDVVVPEDPTTGSVIPLARVPVLDGLEAQMICVMKSDTVNTHGRWALKPEFRTTLLDRYAFLATGAVSG